MSALASESAPAIRRGRGTGERIAVIGQGIAGMTAAWLLAPDHDLVVYEAGGRPGGHTNTIDVEVQGKTYPVDTGFIVFNTETYPNFVKILRRLDVTWQSSDMSFGMRCDRTGLEYGSADLNALFAQRRNLLRPSYWRLLRDVPRFNREALELLEPGDMRLTLGRYLHERGYSQEFIRHHIIPLGAAVWSSPPDRMLEFPARSFARFFHNHGFLRVSGRTPWLTVKGGSQSYVQPLTSSYSDRIRLATPVTEIRRRAGHVEVRDATGGCERFDRVILATHGDTTLRLLSNPTPGEVEVLSAFAYQLNPTVLHTDPSPMPRRRRAWSSWNYLIPEEERGSVSVTYWMNRLQNLEAPVPFLVSLNLSRGVSSRHVLRRIKYQHPLFTPESVAAQRRHDEIDGADRIHYCGAYWGYGFHEDGVKSALRVCARLGRTL